MPRHHEVCHDGLIVAVQRRYGDVLRETASVGSAGSASVPVDAGEYCWSIPSVEASLNPFSLASLLLIRWCNHAS